MATVSSFENLQFPTKSELRQFAELFAPLFKASSEEAKRQAVAALSQCPQVPQAVALFIGSQPIGVSAIFLTCSQSISDETLITIARTQGAAHAHAITRRENLSPMVIDALVDVRQAYPVRGVTEAAEQAPTVPEIALVPPVLPAPPFTLPEIVAEPAAPMQAPVANREEALREELKGLVRHLSPPKEDRLGLRTATEMQEALLVRFARTREADHFATTLADSLSASRWLAERIMLDISGLQLATTLVSLNLHETDTALVLTRFYPHLAERIGEATRAEALLHGLDPAECDIRVEAWRRADSYTFGNSQRGFGEDRSPATSQNRGVQQLRPDRDLRTFGRR